MRRKAPPPRGGSRRCRIPRRCRPDASWRPSFSTRSSAAPISGEASGTCWRGIHARRTGGGSSPGHRPRVGDQPHLAHRGHRDPLHGVSPGVRGRLHGPFRPVDDRSRRDRTPRGGVRLPHVPPPRGARRGTVGGRLRLRQPRHPGLPRGRARGDLLGTDPRDGTVGVHGGRDVVALPVPALRRVSRAGLLRLPRRRLPHPRNGRRGTAGGIPPGRHPGRRRARSPLRADPGVGRRRCAGLLPGPHGQTLVDAASSRRPRRPRRGRSPLSRGAATRSRAPAPPRRYPSC